METYARDEMTFDVVDQGPSDGPVVILLHGVPQSAKVWSGFMPS